MPRLEVPFVPQRLVPGSKHGIPVLPSPRASVRDAWRIFIEREEWLWRHHRTPETKAFLAPMRGGSVDFDDASNESVHWDMSPVTAYPMTIACWTQPHETVTQGIFGLFDKDSANHYLTLRRLNSAEGDTLGMQAWTGAVSADAKTSGTISNGTWYHILGAAAGDTDRDVWRDGAHTGSSTTSLTLAVSGFDRVAMGRRMDSTPSQPFNGLVAEGGLWASDDDGTMAAQLAAGFSPLMVARSSLVFYAPMVRGTPWAERFSGLAGTVGGAPGVERHPAVIYPRGARSIFVPAGAVGASGSAAIAGGGALTAAVRKEARQPATVTGGGAAVASGGGARTGLAALAGGGVAPASGGGAHAGPTAIAGGGGPSATGAFSVFQAAAITGGGAASATRRKGALGAPALAGGGAPTADGLHAALLVLLLVGGGSALVGATGAHLGSGVLPGGGAPVVDGEQPPRIGAVALLDAALGAATVADAARGEVELSEVRITP